MTQNPEHADPALRRRTLLQATAVLGPLAAGLAATTVHAGGHAAAQPNAIKHSFALGEFNVSTLLAGTRTVEAPQNIFGMNVDAETFESVSSAHFLPVDAAQFFFTPTVVQAGADTVLFDTGLNADSISAPLAAAGIAPEDVTIVVLTHMHGDHIGGLLTADGSPTFPNARYVTGQVEFDAWAQMGNERFDKLVRPLAENMTFLGAEDTVVSGITAHATFGHTPGHM
ncbi:MAG: MBL fold metallo-hydrolase, partial [Pseudomonadota bacterium]